jgi:hypothetical protein
VRETILKPKMLVSGHNASGRAGIDEVAEGNRAYRPVESSPGRVG